MDIGKTNTLYIARRTDNGFYLENPEGEEVLLPNAYITEDMAIDDVMDVFVYRDSEQRVVATTLIPYTEIDKFAYLNAKQVDQVGAFFDWGLLKDLFVPFAEQPFPIEEGKSYLIFTFLDEKTDRIIGSARENDFLFFDDIKLKVGDEVDLLLYKSSDLGMNAIVNNLHKGLIFASDIHQPLEAGQRIKGYVKKVRQDGKLDLSLIPIGYRSSIDTVADTILDSMQQNEGVLLYNDKSSPAEINTALGLSKNAFKRGIGYLLKNKKIQFVGDDIKLMG